MAPAGGSNKGVFILVLLNTGSLCGSASLIWFYITVSLHSDDESTIKVAPKEKKEKSNGIIKLKKPAPKHSKPGNWRDGSVIDGTLLRAIFDIQYLQHSLCATLVIDRN